MEGSVAVLIIGSNFGNRREFLEASLRKLSVVAVILRNSHIYESADYLGIGRKYLNIVLEVVTVEEEDDFVKYLKGLELEAGRTDVSRERGEVPLDIDIVVWNNEIRRPTDYNSAFFIQGYRQIHPL